MFNVQSKLTPADFSTRWIQQGLGQRPKYAHARSPFSRAPQEWAVAGIKLDRDRGGCGRIINGAKSMTTWEKFPGAPTYPPVREDARKMGKTTN